MRRGVSARQNEGNLCRKQPVKEKENRTIQTGTHLTLGPGIRTSCPRTCGTCGSLNISGPVTVTIRGVRFSGGSGSAIEVGQGATVRAINCTIEKRRAALVSLPSFLPELLVCVRC